MLGTVKEFASVTKLKAVQKFVGISESGFVKHVKYDFKLQRRVEIDLIFSINSKRK